MVPISVCSASSPTQSIHRFVLDKEQAEVTLEGVKEDDWVKLNMGAVGFYRTQYEPDMLQALIPGILNKTMPPRDRLGLQNDLFALVSA